MSQTDAPPISPRTLIPALVAPCGLDCGLCICHQRTKNPCPGCRRLDGNTRSSCAKCALRGCTERRGRFCSSRCRRFPCARLRRLDARYRMRYGVSALENLAALEARGIRAFVAEARVRWCCPVCGSLRCVHQGACAACGARWRPPHGADALRR